MYIRRLLLVIQIVAALSVAGCATSGGGLGSAEKTGQLRPGMTNEDVVDLLGEPKSSQMVEGKWIVRWSLHQMWKGWVPYDLEFDPKTKTLLAWAANEEDYRKSQEVMGKLATALSAGSGGRAPAAGPNDPELMRKMAGSYYSFSSAGLSYSGGTERKVVLCPSGRYYDSSESSYSNDAGTSDAWGAASQGSGGGTWRIQGDLQQGTITMIDSRGNATSYQYSRCGEDCIYFGQVKFAYAGPADCR